MSAPSPVSILTRARLVSPVRLVTLYVAVPFAVSPFFTDEGRKLSDASGVVIVKLDISYPFDGNPSANALFRIFSEECEYKLYRDRARPCCSIAKLLRIVL